MLRRTPARRAIRRYYATARPRFDRHPRDCAPHAHAAHRRGSLPQDRPGHPRSARHVPGRLASASAVADFFAHDVPDFLVWCERLHASVCPDLYPARVVWANDKADFLAKLPRRPSPPSSRASPSIAMPSPVAPRLKIVHKFGTLGANIDEVACAERHVAVRVPASPRQCGGRRAVDNFAMILAASPSPASARSTTHWSSAGALRTCRLPDPPARLRLHRLLQLRPHRRIEDPARRDARHRLGLGEVGREIARRAAAFGT